MRSLRRDGSQAKRPSDLACSRADFKSSRGNKTAIELFIAGVRGWEGKILARCEHRRPPTWDKPQRLPVPVWLHLSLAMLRASLGFFESVIVL
jgi:hypothetical protein